MEYWSLVMSFIYGGVLITFIGILLYFLFEREDYFKIFTFYLIAIVKYISMAFMGLGLFVVLILSPIFIPVVNFLKFLLINKKYAITGKIIELKKEPAAYITANSSPEVMLPGTELYTRFFVKINDYTSNTNVIVEIGEKKYNSLHVNEDTTIQCQKLEWRKLYEDIRLYAFT